MTEDAAEPTTDINELFSRNPLELTDDDIDEIILHMRKRRQLFHAAQTTKSGAVKKPSLTEGQAAAQKLNLDIKL